MQNEVTMLKGLYYTSFRPLLCLISYRCGQEFQDIYTSDSMLVAYPEVDRRSYTYQHMIVLLLIKGGKSTVYCLCHYPLSSISMIVALIQRLYVKCLQCCILKESIYVTVQCMYPSLHISSVLGLNKMIIY